MRLVKHSNPDAMPHCWPPDDGTAWRDDGTRDGDGKAGWAFIAGALLVAAILAYAAVTGGGR